MSYDVCKVEGLLLNADSEYALRRVQQDNKLAKSLAVLVASFPFLEIFTEKKASSVVYNIYDYDWEEWSRAMSHVGLIHRTTISKIADEQRIFNSDYKNRQFWSCVYEISRQLFAILTVLIYVLPQVDLER